jgi:hypothetical protein
LLRAKIDKDSETVYTGGIMKYMRKTAASSLIVAFASFAGGFCLAPMSAQAMDMAGGQAMDESADAVSGNDNSVTAWNLCVVNCASRAPQAMAAKKFSADFSADILSGVLDDGDSRLFAFSSGATDLTGTHPPSPDILSSVFKKE